MGARLGAVAAVAGTSLALGVLPVSQALAATLAVGAWAVGLLHPVWPLALVALAVPFGSEVPLRVGGLGGATDLAVGGAVGVWALSFLAQRRARLWFPALGLPIPAFVTALALSVTIAPQAGPAAAETVKWLEFGLVALAAAHVLGEERCRVVLLTALVLAASLEGAVGWYQFVTSSGPEGFLLAGGLLRAYGTFGQPNPFAGYLALALPLIVSLALGPPGRRHPPPLPLAIGLAVAAILVGGGIVLSFSRGGGIAAAAGVAVVLALHSRLVRTAFLLGTLLLVVGLLAGALDLLPPQVVGRFAVVTQNLRLFDARSVTVTPENYAVVERMAVWQAAATMFADHPLLGVGAGNFDVAYPRYALRGWPTPPGHAHNAYLTLLAEVGIVGAVAHGLMLVGLFLMVGSALRRFRRQETPWDAYPLALGALGMLVALSVHNLLDNLYVHSIPAHLGLMIGGVVGLLLAEREASAPSR